MSMGPPAPPPPPYEYTPHVEMTEYKPQPSRPAAPPPGPAVPPPAAAQPPSTAQAVCQPIIMTQPPAAPSTNVVVVSAGGGVGGNGIGCPMCKNPQAFVNSFTACGIILGICFFPCGLVCCFCMREKKCRNCNFKAG